MAKSQSLRVARLLTQLENPELSDDEITAIKSKIDYFESRRKKA